LPKTPLLKGQRRFGTAAFCFPEKVWKEFLLTLRLLTCQMQSRFCVAPFVLLMITIDVDERIS
jgi:hypothetical protein